MFGHFELPHFKMNAMVEMPDHGELKVENFQVLKVYTLGTFIYDNTKRISTILATAFRTTLLMPATTNVA
jgi:hypothetical protein